MAITMRTGFRAEFNPSRMLPGEWGVSIDPETQNQIVWMCFGGGVVKRMGTYEDLVEHFQVDVEKIKSVGLVDTYELTYNNEEKFQFDVTNGKDFFIYKTYTTYERMVADLANVPKGEFVLTLPTSTSEAKLYVKDGDFKYIADLAGFSMITDISNREVDFIVDEVWK